MISDTTKNWFEELKHKPGDDVHTRGNVIVNKIKVGDIHYEYDYGCCIKSRVLTEPVRSEGGFWTWKSQRISPDDTDSERIIQYGVHEEHTHYASKLYDYEAYGGAKRV